MPILTTLAPIMNSEDEQPKSRPYKNLLDDFELIIKTTRAYSQKWRDSISLSILKKYPP
jgi:hypothetical protein